MVCFGLWSESLYAGLLKLCLSFCPWKCNPPWHLCLCAYLCIMDPTHSMRLLYSGLDRLFCTGIRGWKKSKILRAIRSKGIKKKLGPSIFLRARFGFSNIVYTSGIEISQHFCGPFLPLVLPFCGPSPNLFAKYCHICTLCCGRVSSNSHSHVSVFPLGQMEGILTNVVVIFRIWFFA